MKDTDLQFVPVSRYTTKKVKTRDGEVHLVYSLGALANAIQRAPHTIRLWEKSGVIPTPILQGSLPTAQRFYLKKEIEAYVYCVGKCLKGKGYSVAESGFKTLLRDVLEDVKKDFNQRILANLEKKKK